MRRFRAQFQSVPLHSPPSSAGLSRHTPHSQPLPESFCPPLQPCFLSLPGVLHAPRPSHRPLRSHVPPCLPHPPFQAVLRSSGIFFSFFPCSQTLPSLHASARAFFSSSKKPLLATGKHLLFLPTHTQPLLGRFHKPPCMGSLSGSS